MLGSQPIRPPTPKLGWNIRLTGYHKLVILQPFDVVGEGLIIDLLSRFQGG